MTGAERKELIEAIQSDSIDNATQYAEEFASRRDLNPATVRSAISRLRRELGLLKRPRGGPLLGVDSPLPGREESGRESTDLAQALVEAGVAENLAEARDQLRERAKAIVWPGLRSPGEGGPTPLAVTLMDVLNRGLTISPELARLGAAVLARYEEDQAFRRAVDESRPEIDRLSEKVAEQVSQIVEVTAALSREERAEFLRLLNNRLDTELLIG
jgi:hypothetical protein